MSRNHHRLGRRLGALFALTSLAVMLAPPVSASVPFGEANFSGYASGTYLHVGALKIGDTNTLAVDAGFSGAVVNSRGLGTPTTDQLGRTVSPALADRNSYGTGFGLDANLLGSDLLAQQHAAAAAPPSTDLVSNRLLGPITVPGVLSAGVLEGHAQARYEGGNCILGADMSFGQGNVADATVLGGPIDAVTDLLDALIGTNPSSQTGGAVRTSSRTRLVPQTNASGQLIGDQVGLMTETKQTLAPVVLFQGIPGAEITINLLGEWTLRAVATGIPGQAYIEYQPGAASGETTVLSIQNTLPLVGEVTNVLNVTLNQLLGIDQIVNDLLSGPGGLLGLGLVEIALNPDPTVVQAADGTSASASVDVARVRLLPGAEGVLGQLTNSLIPGLQLADVRIGHMEVGATVPAGGISCPEIPVTKTADPNPVNAGEQFTYTITVNNPYDCRLTDVRVVDTIATTQNIRYTIRSQDPAASSVSENVVTWNDIGPVPPRDARQTRIVIHVDPEAANGNFINTVAVNAACELEPAQGGTTVNLPVHGGVIVEAPKVQAQVRAPLPRTGGNNVLYVASATGLTLLSLLSAAGYRRLRLKGGGTP